jgi:two-component SAPR family response regulator
MGAPYAHCGVRLAVLLFARERGTVAGLAITLLGSFQVVADGVPVIAFHSDKVRALLGYLAIEADRPHRREALAGLFWPGYPERRALRSLSQALFDLRRALSLADGLHEIHPLLTADVKSIVFHSDALCLDVARFTGLVEGCRGHEHQGLQTCSDCAVRLQEAVSLYAGDLLAGYSLPSASVFIAWPWMPSVPWWIRLKRAARATVRRVAVVAGWNSIR